MVFRPRLRFCRSSSDKWVIWRRAADKAAAEAAARPEKMKSTARCSSGQPLPSELLVVLVEARGRHDASAGDLARSPSLYRTIAFAYRYLAQARGCAGAVVCTNRSKIQRRTGRHSAARAVRPCFNVCACAHGTAASAGARSAGALRPPCFPAPSYRAGPTCAIGNLRTS